jgi:hypothetical protein
MLYDLAEGPPRRGTLLESVFMVLVNRRQEQEFLKTRLLVEAVLAPHTEQSKLSDTFKDYAAQAFPHLHKQEASKDSLAKKALAAWTGIDKLYVKPLWEAAPQRRKMSSRLHKARQKVEELEENRRKRPHMRME